MSELSGGVGTDGLWQNKREVPIKGGWAPQLERGADGSEEGHFPVY